MYESLEHVARDVAVCTKCDLHKGRVKSVPGEGPSNAKVMFIGEGPGYNEDQQGRPFVGQAGQFLEDLLRLAGLEPLRGLHRQRRQVPPAGEPGSRA